MRSFTCALIILAGSVLYGQAVPNFSFVSVNNNYSITCSVKEISLSVSTSYTGQANYSWLGPNYTATGAAVTMTAPGNYTMTMTTGTISTNGIVPIGINTIAPVCSPASLTFAASNSLIPQLFTFTAISPTINITHYIYGPVSQVPDASGGIYAICLASGPGTYTHCMVDNVNGCSTCPTDIDTGFSPTVGTHTSLKENDLQRFSSFPNPTTGSFKIIPADPDILIVKVYNSGGEQVKADYVLTSELTVNMAEVPKGIYTVELIGRSGSVSHLRLIRD